MKKWNFDIGLRMGKAAEILVFTFIELIRVVGTELSLVFVWMIEALDSIVRKAAS